MASYFTWCQTTAVVNSARPSSHGRCCQLLKNSVTRNLLLTSIIPPPRRGGGGIKRWSASVVRMSVCPSVCLMSRTSALTRKPKGLGRRNFAQGYPRSHATPTPTSRSKGQSQGHGAAEYCGEHQESCHLANGCRYSVIKILLNIAMLIIIQSNHFRVNSAV